MAADRPSPNPASPERREEVHETVRAEAFPLQLPEGALTQIDLSYRSARRLLNIGASTRAFGELVRASRSFPMSRRLAAHLVRIALAAKTVPAAATLLQAGAEDGEGSERFAVRRQLARLYRISGNSEAAREALVTVLAEDPADRRARRVLNVLLEREQRWEELDASYEKEVNEALRRGRRDRAARSALARARLSARLGHAAHAALRYGQAAQFLEQSRQHAAAFEVRLHWLSALLASGVARDSLGEAIQTCRVDAERTGQVNRLRATLRTLGLSEDGGFSRVGKTPTAPDAEALRDELTPTPLPDPLRSISHPGFGWKTAAPQASAADPEPVKSALELRQQEAQFVAAGRWKELAAFYRGQIARAPDGSAKVELLSRLAEVLEDELQEPRAAAQAYGEIVALQGEIGALREQLRILRALGDEAGISDALDRAIQLATTPDQRADAHAERGDRALAAKDYVRARGDFLAALRAQPRHLTAKVGLAEAAAASGELRPLRALLEPAPAISRKHPGRAELFRRLARLADKHDGKLARIAWTEVHQDLPDDDEAHRRLLSLVRSAGDDRALEPLLRAQLRREPRGPETRKARMELVAALERLDRADEALAEIRTAVRFEPGHKDAWLVLADRCERRGEVGEAAWALEQAATATDDSAERASTWDRLARFCREVLRDPAKAALYSQRAENARAFASPVSGAAQTSLAVTIPAPPKASITGEHARGDAVSRSGDPTDPEGTATRAPAEPAATRGQARGDPTKPDAEALEGEEATPTRERGAPDASVEASAASALQEPTPIGAPSSAPGAATQRARRAGDTDPNATPTAPRWPEPPDEHTPTDQAPALTQQELPAVEVPTPAAVASRTEEMPAVGVPAEDQGSTRGPPPQPGASATQEIPVENPRATREGPPGEDPRDTRDVPALDDPRATREVPAIDDPRATREVPAVEDPHPARAADARPPSREQPASRPRSGASRGPAGRSRTLKSPAPPARSGVKAALPPRASLDQIQFDKLRSQVPKQPKVDPSEILEWEAPPGQLEVRRKTEELLIAPDDFDPDPETSGFVPAAGSDRLADRDRLAKLVLDRPLDPGGYRQLSELFARYHDVPRADLMREIADALENRPTGPLRPARALSPLERAGLRHPALRNDLGELLSLTGLALCRAAGPRSLASIARDEFRLDSGAGSRAVAEALLTAVRALSIRAPDLVLSEENGPPVTATFQGAPKLLIGRLAVRRELPEGELRFFAARALFSLNAELMSLLTLPSDGLARALSLIGTALKPHAPAAGPAHAIREALGPKSRERVRTLYRKLDTALDVEKLLNGAVDSANRAGLVVAGGIAPAFAALHNLGAGQRELIELVRFASSERYLSIRENKPTRVTSPGGR